MLSSLSCSRDRKTSLAHPFAWTASGGVVVLPAAALLAALGPQLTPCWAALVRLMVLAAASSAALFLQQASGEAALLVTVASATASLAASDPQLTLDGAALVTLRH